MAEPPDDDQYSEEEAERRFEQALKGALNTPPKPLKEKPRQRPKRAASPRRARSKDD